eukprot:PITA_33918
MTDDQYTSIFLELLRYVPYLGEEKAKVHRFINGLPVEYIVWIEFNEPGSLEEAIQKLKHCYKQLKHKVEPKHVLKKNEKDKGNGHQREEDLKMQSGGRCQIYIAQEAHTVGDVGHSIPRIYADVDNMQVDHQASIIEIDDKLCDQIVSILIDPRSNYNYINHDLVDKCGLRKEVHEESWLVHLATGMKKRVHHWVRSCAFELNGMPTTTHLNVLPLGSYGMLLGMDWLYLQRNKVDCFNKAIEYVDDSGEKRTL